MKLLYQFFLLLISTFLCISIVSAVPGISQMQRDEIDKIYGKSENPQCSDTCLSLEKLYSIFPLQGEEATLKTPLNEFTWKYVFIYDNHVSVFEAGDQLEPVSGDYSKFPAQTDFLNNYPLESIITPCNSGLSLCTIQEFKDQVMKPNEKLVYKTPAKISEVLGSEANKDCIIMTQELETKPEEMHYLCSKDIQVIGKLKQLLSTIIGMQAVKENVARVHKLNDAEDKLFEMNLHLDDKFLLGNNKDEPEIEAAVLPGYQEFLKFSLATDFNQPAAQMLLKEGVKIPWKGPADKKPEEERCWRTSTKTPGTTIPRFDYFCIYTHADGIKTLTPSEGYLVSQDWVDRLNKIVYNKKVDEAKNSVLTATPEKPIDPETLAALGGALTLACDAQMKACLEAVKVGKKTKAECDAQQLLDVSNNIDAICKSNPVCMQGLLAGVQSGAIGVVVKGPKDDVINNPYAKQPASCEGGAGSPAPAEGDAIKKEPLPLGPNVEDVMKAINTFRVIFAGAAVEKMDGIAAVCEGKKDSVDTARAIALVPFIARFDPWLEYLGHVRDVQTSANK